MSNSACERSDWACHGPACIVAWGLPILALVLSGSLAPAWMPVVWPVAFTWMGVACLLNSRRCGRVHCLFTGLFFLALAVLSALYGFGVPLGGIDWSWISTVSVVGGVGLTVIPEMLLGRYRNPSPRSEPPRD